MDMLVQHLQAALEQKNEAPLYQVLADTFASFINSGELEEGLKLPTSRSLASSIGIHRNTVNKVYEELNNRGLVKSVVGSGTFVNAPQKLREPPALQGTSAIPWNSLVSSIATAEPLTRYHRLNRYVGEGDYINLSRMHPSNELIPSELIRKCTDTVIRENGPAVFGYGSAQGLAELRQLISVELHRAGIPADKDSIIITTGSQQALDLVARLLCNPGDTILMEEHSYTGAINAFTSIGATIRPMPCDEDGPLLSALESVQPGSAKALYLMPSCSNPTGRTISLERRKELLEWSTRKGVPIIEDDYGADLDDESSPRAIRGLDANIIYLGTFSKKLAPALRVGFIISPVDLVSRLISLKQAMDLGTSLLQQYVLAEFIKRGYLRSHLRKIQPVYHNRRMKLAETLEKHLPAETRLRVPDSGVLLWLQLPAGLNSEDLFREALDYGVLVSPGSFHSVSPLASSGIRLTFCAEDETRLEEGGINLCKAIESLLHRAQSFTNTNRSAPLDGV
jgi:DNA-binding transcriptional MocR family regulator